MGTNNKQSNNKSLAETIAKINSESLENQKNNLIEKFENWLWKNFTESQRTGDYDYGKPYISSNFDTYEEMMEDFHKTMEK